MVFTKQDIRPRTRYFRKMFREAKTDGMPVGIMAYPVVAEVIELLEGNGYSIVSAECYVRYDSLAQFFLVGEIVATKGDGDLIYKFTPAYNLSNKLSFGEVLAGLSVRQDGLLYNGDPLEMGRGQYRTAKRLAQELAKNHPLLADDTEIYIPCLTRKGRGGWGRTVAGKQFCKGDFDG